MSIREEFLAAYPDAAVPLLLEEIEALQSCIASAIYIAKKEGDLGRLEQFVTILNVALTDMVCRKE